MTLLSFKVFAELKFNNDIRPILSDKCFHCHGPDKADRKAGLRLDTADGLLTDLGGYFAIVPGNPEDSAVYKRITHSDPEERMPPEHMHKDLTEAEKNTIKQWIKEGASYQNHWSFEPIIQESIPKVKQESWVHNPIDNFVLSRLEQENLSPSNQADKYTLIRRLALDLTGLPPTAELIKQFTQDASDKAYEKAVDTLMASPSFGEHQAHYWLDAARYADTHGLHLDNLRSIWPYRDWVVNAFNQNQPFDQFTIEQLAGDLLPNPTPAQLIATGFVRSNPSTSEGGAIDAEYAAIYAKDRTETLSTVWMGLTTGCAGCHDHKFDPISQKEFYQLTAFFRNTTESAMDGNAADYPPSMHVYSPEDALLTKTLKNKDESLKDKIKHLSTSSSDAIKSWIKSANKQQSLPLTTKELAFHLPANEGKGSQLKTQLNQKYSTAKITGKYQWVDGKQGKALAINKSTLIELGDAAEYDYEDSFSVSFWIKPPKEDIKAQPIISRINVDPEKGWWDRQSKTAGWFVEALNNKSLRLSLNFGNTAFIHGSFWNVMEPDAWHHITIQYDGSANQNAFRYFVNGEERGKAQAKSLSPEELATVQQAKIDSPLAIGFVQNPYANKEDRNAPDNVEKNNKTPYVAIQDIRVYNNVLTPEENNLIAKLPDIQQALLATKRTAKQQTLLSAYYTSQFSQKGQQYYAERRAQIPKITAIHQRTPITLILEEKKDSKPFAHILNRGQYDDEGEKVFSGTLALLPKIEKTEGLNRLDLAKWLVRDDHPLTARVTINRFWQYIFGRGLVETAGDFGSQGTPPTHPELLDWLASDFKQNGWDMKRAIKQMVMSATYQQSSAFNELLLSKDSLNTLYARASRPRLHAEVIRDQALVVSGLLNEKMGGKPVKPYQPAGLWKAVAYTDSNTAKFEQDHGDKLYRKSLYTFRKRTASPPGMSLFDAPDRESCVVQREETNTPLQALLLMNDPQFVEAARNMAQRVLTTKTEDKFSFLINQTLGRLPDEKMLSSLQMSYQQLNLLYQSNETAAKDLISIGESEVDTSLDPIELATWTMLANQVFNLDEFITRN
ncbi:DUF1553 domain-containing protein [Paraglaciecola sp.]|uniref:DUF1553 domain-containing protein n=1 Tax=Paraglaciecola sp. TaxID=1920173 RepID=UPI003EF392CF